jgi:hypothetical protein
MKQRGHRNPTPPFERLPYIEGHPNRFMRNSMDSSSGSSHTMLAFKTLPPLDQLDNTRQLAQFAFEVEVVVFFGDQIHIALAFVERSTNFWTSMLFISNFLLISNLLSSFHLPVCFVFQRNYITIGSRFLLINLFLRKHLVPCLRHRNR